MIRKPVTIQNNMDMEDRPVAHLVQEASQYASQVYILMGSKTVSYTHLTLPTILLV